MMDPEELPSSSLTPPLAKSGDSVPVDALSRRAYEKWLARSKTLDGQLLDWIQAEEELGHAAVLAKELAEAQERIVGVVAESRVMERWLTIEHAVSCILATSGSFTDAASKLLETLGLACGWNVGAVWMRDRETEVLRCAEYWHSPNVESPAFERDTRTRSLGPQIGLPGRVWATNSVVWIHDMTTEPNFSRENSASNEVSYCRKLTGRQKVQRFRVASLRDRAKFGACSLYATIKAAIFSIRGSLSGLNGVGCLSGVGRAYSGSSS